ncbi:hypothetical protein LY78DRAFT_60957 [Colletotrichum sublineola]|nr:hypothetical protein LY78DRAFT_60957 [Colletotrichum sublineola]
MTLSGFGSVGKKKKNKWTSRNSFSGYQISKRCSIADSWHGIEDHRPTGRRVKGYPPYSHSDAAAMARHESQWEILRMALSPGLTSGVLLFLQVCGVLGLTKQYPAAPTISANFASGRILRVLFGAVLLTYPFVY